MPDGLLLLAFALTLVANAALIAVAIRAMRPGGRLADEPERAPRARVRAAREVRRPQVMPAVANAVVAVAADEPVAPLPSRSIDAELETATASQPASADQAGPAGSAEKPRPARQRRAT